MLFLLKLNNTSLFLAGLSALISLPLCAQERNKQILQIDSVFSKDKKSYLRCVEEYVNSGAVDYHDKCVLLYNDYLYAANPKYLRQVKKIYIEYFKKECRPCYDEQFSTLFFAYIDDQRYRFKSRELKKSNNTRAHDSIIDLRRKVDAANRKILDLINKPDKYLCNENYTCNQALENYFILVQHSNLEIMEHNVAYFDSLWRNGQLAGSRLALLIDRIKMEKKLPQVYGTQLKYNFHTQKNELYQLENEAEVDIFRKRMGLEPLAAYLKKFGIIYTPLKHIEK